MSISKRKECKNGSVELIRDSVAFFVVGLGSDGKLRCFGDSSKLKIDGDIRHKAMLGMVGESIDLVQRVNEAYLKSLESRATEARVLEFKEARSKELQDA